MELDAAIELFASTSDKVDKIHSSILKPPVNPIYKPVGNSIVATGAAVQVIEIVQTPSEGRMWYVRQLGLFGSDGHTVVASALADVYLGPEQEYIPGSPVTDYSAQLLSGVAIPSITHFGHFDKPLHQGEHIYALLYAMSNGQQVSLVAQVSEFPVSSREAMNIS